MVGTLYLAWRHICHHRWTAVILVAAITLIGYLPIALNLIVNNAEEHLRARSDSTPLLIGPRGSQLELVLASLYFDKPSEPFVRMEQIERVERHSAAKHAKTAFASEYMVGALARFNNNHEKLHPAARLAAANLGLKAVCNNPFHNNTAQLVETVHCVEDAIALIGRHPWLGVGFGGTPEIDTYLGVSSVYLLIAEEMGILGLGVFLLAMARFFTKWARALRLTRAGSSLEPMLLGAGLAVAGGLFGGILDHYLFNLDFPHAASLLWVVVGLGAVATKLVGQDTATQT